MTRWKEISGANERTAKMEPIGIIDIGSNSVRLVVYEGAVRAQTPVFNEKVLCGLGRSVATTGNLGKEAVERALAALARFRVIAHILSVKNIRVIATAAVRDARDGHDFIERGERILGNPIEVLSGEKEARLAAQGIMMGFVDDDGIAGDLGGGSLELVDLARDRLKEAATLPLGGLRLIDTTGNKIERAIDIIDGALASLPWLANGQGRTFYAVGGTWRSLAKLHMDQIRYPLRVMQGYKLSAREAIDLCEQFRKAKKPSDIPGMAGIARARRELLPFGALVLERLIRCMQPRQIVFSVFGIREGLIYGLLPPHEQMRDPLISFCEDYAALRSRSVEYAWSFAIGRMNSSPIPPLKKRPTNVVSGMRHASYPMWAGARIRITGASKASIPSLMPALGASTTRAVFFWHFRYSIGTKHRMATVSSFRNGYEVSLASAFSAAPELLGRHSGRPICSQLGRLE